MCFLMNKPQPVFYGLKHTLAEEEPSYFHPDQREPVEEINFSKKKKIKKKKKKKKNLV